MTHLPHREADDGGPLLPHGLSEIADRYDVVLCDLWGVVHDGRRVFAPALDALRRFRAGGGTVVYITNAPRPRDPVLAQLTGLGVTPDTFDGIVTSGDVTVKAIAQRGEVPVYHIGPERDLALFEAVFRRTGVRVPLTGLDEAAYVVVTGLFDDTRETPDDYAVALDTMRRRDLTIVCANPDIVVHVGDKVIYCGGALAERYAEAGGRTVLAGKPHPPIYAAALELAASRRVTALDRSRVLAIGDGVKTDVAGAVGQGLDVLFLTSGIHRDEFLPLHKGALDRLAHGQALARLAHRPFAASTHLVW